MKFPVTLTPDEGTLLVTFVDIPEAITFGKTLDEALAMAQEALETALQMYVENNQPVPAPSQPMKGQRTVELSEALAAQVAQHNADYRARTTVLNKLPAHLLNDLMSERGHAGKTISLLSELELAQMIGYYNRLLRYQSEAGYIPDDWPPIPREEFGWSRQILFEESERDMDELDEITRTLAVDSRIKRKRPS